MEKMSLWYDLPAEVLEPSQIINANKKEKWL